MTERFEEFEEAVYAAVEEHRRYDGGFDRIRQYPHEVRALQRSELEELAETTVYDLFDDYFGVETVEPVRDRMTENIRYDWSLREYGDLWLRDGDSSPAMAGAIMGGTAAIGQEVAELAGLISTAQSEAVGEPMALAAMVGLPVAGVVLADRWVKETWDGVYDPKFGDIGVHHRTEPATGAVPTYLSELTHAYQQEHGGSGGWMEEGLDHATRIAALEDLKPVLPEGNWEEIIAAEKADNLLHAYGCMVDGSIGAMTPDTFTAVGLEEAEAERLLSDFRRRTYRHPKPLADYTVGASAVLFAMQEHGPSVLEDAFQRSVTSHMEHVPDWRAVYREARSEEVDIPLSHKVRNVLRIGSPDGSLPDPEPYGGVGGL